jgi:hypothetical protein
LHRGGPRDAYGGSGGYLNLAAYPQLAQYAPKEQLAQIGLLVDPDPHGWNGAGCSLLEWVYGSTPAKSNYGPDSLKTKELSQSSIADDFREGFLNKNSGKPCRDWEAYTNVKLKFGVKAFFSDLLNGTAHFVGSGRGDAAIVEKNEAKCYVRVSFKITNTTSLKSAIYHIIPNSWNNTRSGTPCANWTQTYTWEENFCCTVKP